MSDSLGDTFTRQQARLRVCLKHGQAIGPAGAFYCASIEDILRRADEAAMSQDIFKMLAIYKEMEEVPE